MPPPDDRETIVDVIARSVVPNNEVDPPVVVEFEVAAVVGGRAENGRAGTYLESTGKEI